MKEISEAKIERLLAKLDDGKAVSLRDLENTLGKDGISKYEKLWADEQEKRDKFKCKPRLIKYYDELIKQADFANNKHQKNKNNHPSPQKNYEAVINLHRKIVIEDLALANWFDRNVKETSADVEGVGRLITSRSEYKKIDNIAIADKEDVKRTLLKNELRIIKEAREAYAKTPEAVANKEKLKILLAKLKKASF